ALEITLTSGSKDANGGGIPMCGVPFHAVDGYIGRLVKKGFRVAICDQVEDPRKAKGLVRREVVRVVSPGTLTDASYLDAREPAFLMSIAPAGVARGTQTGDTIGVALLVDPTTLKHLEILEGSDGGRDGSLLDELDRTITAVASRLLRSWLLRPLVALEAIRDRLDAVEELAFRTTERGRFRDAIKAVQDLERLVARAALGTAGPRDLAGLQRSLAAIPRVRTVLSELQAPLVCSLVAGLDDLADIRAT